MTVKGFNWHKNSSCLFPPNKEWTLAEAVRHGLAPNMPVLLTSYLKMSGASEFMEPSELWNTYRAQFELLLDTFCDHLVVEHWRYLCLDHINQPLGKLHQLARDQNRLPEYYALEAELRTLSHHL